MESLRNQVLAVGMATGLSLGIAACGSDSKSAPSAATEASVQLDTQKLVADYCAVQTVEPTGPDMLRNLGHDVHGRPTFFTDMSREQKDVAKALAPNNMGLATAYTILKSETGVNSNNVAIEAAQLTTSMENSSRQRSQVCEFVIGRVVDTPSMRDYRSSTGRITEFVPDRNVKGGIDANTTANNLDLRVFTIAPEHGSKNKVLEESISKEWGITAEGEVIMTALDNEGKIVFDKHGNPVQVGEATPTVSPNSTATPAEKKAGTISKGPQPEENPGPNEGPNKESKPGTDQTPSGGGSTPGTTPNTRPGTTTTSRPGTTTSTIPGTTTTTRGNVPSTTTTTTTIPTTTTTSKGSESGCVPNPPFVYCP